MDEEKKDNLTDVIEHLPESETPEDDLPKKTEQEVINNDGETVTLDQGEEPK